MRRDCTSTQRVPGAHAAPVHQRQPLPALQDVAERVAREALRRHFTPTVMSAHAYLKALETLPSWRAVVWVASTTGQGEPPATFRALWRALLRRSLPPTLLSGQTAAVFGLGDSGYTQYNVVAKKLYRRLQGLGALMLGPAGLGDDRAPGGHEAALAPWLTDLWRRLRAHIPLAPGLAEVGSAWSLLVGMGDY